MCKNKPTAIITKTVKGKGVSFMENNPNWHGKAPNEEEYNIAIKDQIEIEAKYHELTNGGHLTTLELGSKSQGNAETFEKNVRLMKDSGIGYGKLIIK